MATSASCIGEDDNNLIRHNCKHKDKKFNWEPRSEAITPYNAIEAAMYRVYYVVYDEAELIDFWRS